MFTGIVSRVGTIENLDDVSGGLRFSISAPSFFQDSKIGDSVCVNGVCLTIEKISVDKATFFVQIETLKKTTLGNFKSGSSVNLELAMRMSDRLGGHIVQGHVDSVGEIIGINKLNDGSLVIDVEIEKEQMKYVIAQGSICINGVSLTVADKNENKIKIGLILETINKTTFNEVKIGDKVNIEVDLIGKYVENIMKV